MPALTLGPLSEAPTAAGEGRAARWFSGRQSLLPLFRFLGSRHFRVTSHKVSELRRLQEEVAPDASQSSGGSEAMSWARRSAFCSHWPGEAGGECAQNKVIKTEGCRFRTLPSTREEFHFLLASLGLRFRQLESLHTRTSHLCSPRRLAVQTWRVSGPCLRALHPLRGFEVASPDPAGHQSEVKAGGNHTSQTVPGLHGAKGKRCLLFWESRICLAQRKGAGFAAKAAGHLCGWKVSCGPQAFSPKSRTRGPQCPLPCSGAICVSNRSSISELQARLQSLWSVPHRNLCKALHITVKVVGSKFQGPQPHRGA